MHNQRTFLTLILCSTFVLWAGACGQDTLGSGGGTGGSPGDILPPPIPLVSLMAEAMGHPGCDGCETFEWQITAPSGALLELAGLEVDVPVDEQGTWQADLTVHYLHEASPGVLYSARASLAFDVAE